MSRPLEANLLRTFRLFLSLRFALAILASLHFVYTQEFHTIFPGLTLSTLVVTGVLILYLYSNSLRMKLGAAFLPIALAGVTLSLIFEQRIVQLQLAQINLALMRDIPSVLEPFILPGIENAAIPLLFSLGTTAFLFVPLVLISWQYRFRSVIAFTLGTTLLDFVLMLTMSRYVRFDWPIELLGMGFRNTSFLIVGYIVTTLMTTKRQQRRQLKEANQKLAAYATTREQLLVSQERNRLARELHDTVAHTLSAVVVKLNAVELLWDTDSQRAKTMLAEVIGAMNEGMAETRRALRDLRASPLEDMGLVLAIRHLAENAAQRGGFALDLHTPQRELHFMPDVEHAVYRITQEALANAVEHANASEVSLTMMWEAACLKLSIADNGCGFDPETASHNAHFGLLGMRERAEMINGHLHIHSKRQSGTTVELLVETGT